MLFDYHAHVYICTHFLVRVEFGIYDMGMSRTALQLQNGMSRIS